MFRHLLTKIITGWGGLEMSDKDTNISSGMAADKFTSMVGTIEETAESKVISCLMRVVIIWILLISSLGTIG